MRTQRVDPRDTRWEIDSPDYRVYFWKRASGPPDVPASLLGWESNEFLLTEVANVQEVMAWADQRVDPKGHYTLYVVVDGPNGPGLIHLSGTDPTRMR